MVVEAGGLGFLLEWAGLLDEKIGVSMESELVLGLTME